MAEERSTPPVACTLTSSEVQERAANLRSVLSSAYTTAEEQPDGYTVVFDGSSSILPAVATFVSNELQCCSFADYEISLSPPYEETRLTITGPEGTKAMFRNGLIALLETDET